MRAREQLLGAVLCVFSLEFTRQAERIVRRCSRRTLEHPKMRSAHGFCSAQRVRWHVTARGGRWGAARVRVAVTALPSQAV